VRVRASEALHTAWLEEGDGMEENAQGIGQKQGCKVMLPHKVAENNRAAGV
jgi:hypothetical protein